MEAVVPIDGINRSIVSAMRDKGVEVSKIRELSETDAVSFFSETSVVILFFGQ